jgi:LDH2 family malate/lactate/ureidoglycolate dehydrogenase
MKISIDKLKQILVKILQESGISENESEIVADEIIFGQIRGKKSHGLLMLETMLKRAKKATSEIEIIKEETNFCFMDGGGKLGPVVAQKAMDLSIEKTIKNSFSIVAVRNPSPFLTAGYHVWRAAKNHNLIALNLSVAKSKVAPFGSIEPIFGTNPIGFAFPTKDHPIVIDMSITNIPAAKIKQAIEKNDILPENVAINNKGEYTRDPNEALAGALTTFGGYKGSAIALMVELLAGAFLNEKCGNQNGDMRTMLFITLNSGLFFEPDIVFNNASKLRHDVNSSKAIESLGAKLPGDYANELMDMALKNGIELTNLEINLLNRNGASL